MAKGTGYFLLSILAVSLFCGAELRAQESAASFYKGKTINFYIGWAAGSGYDSYSRLAAQHLSRHLPGNPNIVPMNQPGAGSISLANRLYNALPKDGTALGMVGNSLYLQQFLGEPNIQFDTAKFGWVGRLADLTLLLVSWHKSSVSRPEDVFTKPFDIAVPGAGSASNLTLSFVKRLVNARYNLILGYRNGNETRLAMERGEVDATASIEWSALRETSPEWLSEKKVNLLAVIGLRRIPDIPAVPLLGELAQNEDQRKIIDVFMLPTEVGRAILAPPGVPADRMEALRTAFNAMVHDRDFIQDAKSRKIELNPLSGDQLESVVAEIDNMPQRLVEQARALTSPLGR